MNIVWKIENSISPNRYLKSKNTKIRSSKQKSFHCYNCSYLKNIHDLSISNIFGNYSYRSSKTFFDDEIIKFLIVFFYEYKVQSIIEVGGNNGSFFQQVSRNYKPLTSYTIIDKVPIDKGHPKLNHRNEFLSSLSKPLDTDLVIVRHAFAHNKSIQDFARNIVKKFNPKFIYIECADWNLTFLNKDFGQLYSEHYYCLSSEAVYSLFRQFGYGLLNKKFFSIHNGSFGLLLSNSSDINLRQKKQNSELVKKSIRVWSKNIKKVWKNASAQPFILWGCSAKIVFTINALNLSTDKLIAVHDSTPEKYNKFPPGLKVKVSPEPNLVSDEKVNVIIGAKNLKKILQKKIKKIYPNSIIYTL